MLPALLVLVVLSHPLAAETRRTAALPLPPPWPAERAAPLQPPPAPLPPSPPAAAPAPSAPPAFSRGPVTGLPLPRFASLGRSEINLRAGPGTRFPVEWTYQRAGLPVEILHESDTWRRVRDMDGVEGWVQQARLSGRRTFIVRAGTHTLHREASERSPAVARLGAGVLGVIRRCEAASAWCEVEVQGRRGFLPRAAMWGVYPGEEVR
ncbi:MAG: SH3 domain-containing protein [Elioraea sp.]|nr:SH3 domain-containing protein [Elioraea sp.]MDW8445063.1 SH3 domain-containing protein [Acetobacteraceae bacterium]